MFRTTVYDDAFPAKALEVYESEIELEVFKKARSTVQFLRKSGKPAHGYYTFRLEKVKEGV